MLQTPPADLAPLWLDQREFCALDSGGQGLRPLLQLWRNWVRTPGRCQRLHLVWLVEDAATAQAALQQLQPAADPLAGSDDLGDAKTDPALLALLQATWPPLTPNLHPLDLQPGRVQLLLALGPLQRLLPRLHLQAHWLWLRAARVQPAPQRLRVLKALGRLAMPGARALAHATDAPALAELRTAGFVPDPSAPPGHLRAQRPTSRRAGTALAWHAGAPPRTALVIGAGLAGAAVAQALAQLGLQVQVLDRHARPAAETSGNPAALFHGTVNPDDGPHARLFRAAALLAQRSGLPAASTACGLLRLQPAQDGADPVPAMRRLMQRLGLPADYVQALDARQASALAGLRLGSAAWFYPGGGWTDPAAWVRQALAQPGVHFQGGVAVQRLQPAADGWQAQDAEGQVLAQADVLVLANAADSPRLLQALDPALRWPLRQTRGQITQLQHPGPALRCALAGDGYALPLGTGGALLCGATRQAVALADRPGPFTLQAGPGTSSGTSSASADQVPSEDEHAHNLGRLARLTGLQPSPGTALHGRVGYRLHSDNRLPIAGAVPRSVKAVSALGLAPGAAGLPQRDQARHWPRWPGLFVSTALGARGATLAPLLGRLVAAQACAAPWPLERDLADAVDPARWMLREARGPQQGPPGQQERGPKAAPPAPAPGPQAPAPPAQDAGCAGSLPA